MKLNIILTIITVIAISISLIVISIPTKKENLKEIQHALITTNDLKTKQEIASLIRKSEFLIIQFNTDGEKADMMIVVDIEEFSREVGSDLLYKIENESFGWSTFEKDLDN